MNIVIVGHVDHGKSTIIGRLLADTDSLPRGKLEQVRQYCERNAKPFEYAFLLDALRDERSQGITIDSARVFFKTASRSYVINDAPGHVEFLKNMVTGASRAEAALLVIDGHEGVRENSRRHAYLLSMLGLKQLVVLVNKMDLLGNSEGKFRAVVDEFGEYLAKIGVMPSLYIPVAGFSGDNIAQRSASMPWYTGPTLLEALDQFSEAQPLRNIPFRMPVQDVYKFTAQGDTRRIIAGTVESGTLQAGDEVIFYPSGKRSRISSIEGFAAVENSGLSPGVAKGFTLDEQIYVARGELAARAGETPPKVGSRVKTSLFWLGKRPLHSGKDYILKLGSTRARARLERVLRVLDASALSPRADAKNVERGEVAECVFTLAKPIAFDLDQLTPGTTRFVLVDDFEIAGGGLIREDLASSESVGRAARFHQNECLVLLTPQISLPAIESALVEQGRAVYSWAGDAPALLAGQAKILLDAGLIILAQPEIDASQIEALRESLPEGKLRIIETHRETGVDPAREESTIIAQIMRWTALTHESAK